jgi:hypothetical protein
VANQYPLPDGVDAMLTTGEASLRLAADPYQAAWPYAYTAPLAVTNQYPRPSGRAAMLTTGDATDVETGDPWYTADPYASTPSSK